MVGHIEPRGKSFRLVVSGARDKNGKQAKFTKTIKGVTPKEAEKELAIFVAEIEKGQFIDTKKLTLNDFVTRWLKDYAESQLAPKTLHRYRELLDKRILPALGHLRIDQIRPLHIMKFYTNLQEDGMRLDGKPGKLSDRTILHHHRLLSSIMQKAVEWQVIPSNPLNRVPTPKVRKKPAPCYDEEQTIRLFQAIDNEPMKYKVMVLLDVGSGGRRGEIMGLTWDKVNFKDSTIEITRSRQYIPGQGTFTKDPKNETSKRVVSIPSSIMNLLKEYKKHQNEEKMEAGSLWQGSTYVNDSKAKYQFNNVTADKAIIKILTDFNVPIGRVPTMGTVIKKNYSNQTVSDIITDILSIVTQDTQEKYFVYMSRGKLYVEKKADRVFTTWDGKPMHPDTISKWFPEFLKRHNEKIKNDATIPDDEKEKLYLPVVTFHGLRHTSATLLINQGLNVKAVSSRLGHSNASTTMNIYAHALKRADQEAADKLDYLFTNDKKGQKKEQA